MSLQYGGGSGWPFAFECRQTLQLHANALQLTLTLTNRAGHAAPMGLGWHPYFAKRPGSRIRFAAAGRWEMGPDKLPTECLPVSGLDTACATLDVDHCFDGWSGAPPTISC